MKLFSNFLRKSKNFDSGYLKQFMHMNGQRTSLSIQIDNNQNFPPTMRRSKNYKVSVDGEIRNSKIFFGILDAQPEKILLIHPVNNFEIIEDFDHSFELALTLENDGGRLRQYCTYVDLITKNKAKFEIKRHTIHNV